MSKFTEFIIRFGTTGSTARWVAKHYLRLKTVDTADIEVMKKIVEFRYKIFNPNEAKNKLAERLSYLDNLTDLTFSILQLEGAIKTKEMPMHLQMQVTTVIMEELKKKGIPESAILGKKII